MADYLDNANKQMKLALQLVSGYGGEFQSWRLADSNERAYTDIDFYVQMAKTAEKGKIHTLFIADTPSFGGGAVARTFPPVRLPFRLNPWLCSLPLPTPHKKSAWWRLFPPLTTCPTIWLVN